MFRVLKATIALLILAVCSACSRDDKDAPVTAEEEATLLAECEEGETYCVCFVSEFKSRVSPVEFRAMLAGVTAQSEEETFAAWDRLGLSQEQIDAGIDGLAKAVEVCEALE